MVSCQVPQLVPQLTYNLEQVGWGTRLVVSQLFADRCHRLAAGRKEADWLVVGEVSTALSLFLGLQHFL